MDIVDWNPEAECRIAEIITPLQPERGSAEWGRPGETDKEGFCLKTPVPGGYGGFKVAAATFRRPLAAISVSGLRFRCFGHRISKFPAPERWDFNISGSGASGFQDFQLRSVAISIFPASEQLRSVEIKNFEWKLRIFEALGAPRAFSGGARGCLMVPGCSLGGRFGR